MIKENYLSGRFVVNNNLPSYGTLKVSLEYSMSTLKELYRNALGVIKVCIYLTEKRKHLVCCSNDHKTKRKKNYRTVCVVL